ncbi:MAG: hypothetical protein QG673_1468 [Pseudomonadota bacterium]|nr:hypothetical protein [Pseudomonadota bacterium]
MYFTWQEWAVIQNYFSWCVLIAKIVKIGHRKKYSKLTKNIIKYNLVTNTNAPIFICTATVSLFGGWALYIFIEKPFLNLRDKLYQKPKL